MGEAETDKVEQAVKTACEQVLAELESGQSLHWRLQDGVAKLARQFGLTANKEYVLPGFRGDRDGRLDVVWLHNRLPAVAFEIDSSFRRKSIQKLLTVKAELRFWVYYGKSSRNAAVQQIDVEQRVQVIRLQKRSVKPPKTVLPPSKPISSYSVAQIRVNYPKAYEPWSDEDDNLLREKFTEGKRAMELARYFQRKPNAIRAKLRKLKLV